MLVYLLDTCSLKVTYKDSKKFYKHLGKYTPLDPGEGYNVSYCMDLKICWNRIAKCCSTTISRVLKEYSVNGVVQGHSAKSTPEKKRIFHWGHCPYGPEKWDGYFKFCFVRNPWDRLLSSYISKVRNKQGGCSAYLQSFEQNIPFIEFVKIVQDYYDLDRHLMPMHDLVMGKDFSNMDFIGRFENFEEDFLFVLETTGLVRKDVPHRNKTKHKHYTEYYDEETRDIVGKVYKRDIEYFGYEFGD